MLVEAVETKQNQINYLTNLHYFCER